MITDLHIHILPGIDDGPASLAESLQLLRLHYEAGVRNIVATPHIRSDFYLNTQDSINAAWELLQEKATELYPDLRLHYAAEYYADDYFMVLLEKDQILPLFERYVLVETSMRVDQPFLNDILTATIAKGWQPVLAHPERYRQWHHQRERYAELRDLGVLFQINLLSLGGMYGSVQQEIAEQLIQQGWVHAIGSDLHRANQYKNIEQAKQNPHYKAMDSSKLLNNLFTESIRST